MAPVCTNLFFTQACLSCHLIATNRPGRGEALYINLLPPNSFGFTPHNGSPTHHSTLDVRLYRPSPDHKILSQALRGCSRWHLVIIGRSEPASSHPDSKPTLAAKRQPSYVLTAWFVHSRHKTSTETVLNNPS